MLIVDSFAGGGGASTGIEMALGRSPDIAINHDRVALAMHAANHPQTEHLPENVWQVDLEDHARRRGDRIGLLWASPDCRHFSKARGGRPTSPSVRGLAWTIAKFVRQLGPRKPRVIIMENVEEFRTWEDYDGWQAALRAHGYRIEGRELRACDYGAPTIRKRLFIVMRCDGEPIVWPEPTHGPPGDPRVLAGALKPWRTVAEIIDWSVPCPSIFDTSEAIMATHGVRAKRPLADATLKRVAAGVKRYVIDAAEPFFVTYGQQGGRSRSASEPMHTVCASKKDTNCLVVPTLVQIGYGERAGQAPRVPGLDKPLGTAVAGGAKHALVAAFLAQHNTGVIGHDARKPASTIVGKGSTQAVVSAFMMNMKGSERELRDACEPLSTICASTTHAYAVSAFMVKYYGTAIGASLREPCHSVTGADRFGLVTVTIGGAEWAIVDIGMRMLTPRELFRAQGFPDDYVIDRGADGAPITKTQQIHKCGNSVSPWPAAALVSANCGFLKAAAEPSDAWRPAVEPFFLEAAE